MLLLFLFLLINNACTQHIYSLCSSLLSLSHSPEINNWIPCLLNIWKNNHTQICYNFPLGICFISQWHQQTNSLGLTGSISSSLPLLCNSIMFTPILPAHPYGHITILIGRKVMTNLDSILKSRDITLPTKVRLVKAVVFPVVVYGCESWTVKKAECQRIDAFELWCWRRLLRVPWTARRSN